MTEAQIRQNVWRYLLEELSVAQLGNALPDGWELDKAGSPAVRDLYPRVMGPWASSIAATSTRRSCESGCFLRRLGCD